MPIPPIDSSQGESPFFSILILCWNSNAYLRKCLQSVSDQTLKDFEVILIDNGSPEPVPPDLVSHFTDLDIHFYSLEKNIGFAGGNNFAADLSRGQYLVLLNSDAFPQRDWLAEIYQAISRHPECTFASKLIMASDPSRLDGEGDNYHATGLVWRRSFRRPVSHSTAVEKEVFSACAAAAVYPRTAFTAAGGFDPDYFAYTEDVDLGFRLRLAGIPCVYLPSAVVYHVGSGSTRYRSDLSVYYGQRNLVWTFLKNMPGCLLAVLFPFHLLMNLALILVSCFRKQGMVTLRAKRDAFASLG